VSDRRLVDRHLVEVIRWSLYIFAAAMPFAIALTQIAVGIALLAWLGRLVYTRAAKWPRLGVEWGFIAFIAAELLACVFSTNLGQNVIYLKRLLLIPIVYLVAANSSDREELRRLGMIFVVSILLYSVWGIVSYFLNPAVRVRHIQNSMTAGGITMVGAVTAAAFAVRLREMRSRLFMLLAGAVILGCLILTSTRGSWVGFFAAALLILLVQNRRLVWALPLLVLAFYLLQPGDFSWRMRHIFDPAWGTNAKRIHWWSVGWEIFKDHPLVGIGGRHDVDVRPLRPRRRKGTGRPFPQQLCPHRRDPRRHRAGRLSVHDGAPAGTPRTKPAGADGGARLGRRLDAGGAGGLCRLQPQRFF